MAKLVHVLFLILIVAVSSNDIVDLIRCIYQNFVPKINLIFELIDLIKAQDWMKIISLLSTIYTKVKDIIATCKAEVAPGLI